MLLLRPSCVIALALAAGACGNSDSGGGGVPPGPPAAADAGVAKPPPPPQDFKTLAKTAGQHWTVEQRSAAIADGVKVITQHQCTRCHQIDGQPGIGRPFDCTSCHTFLKNLPNDKKHYDQIAEKNGKDVTDRYIRNIEHLLVVPDLTAVGRRIRPEWIATYLAEPFDVRPTLPESMIRNKVSADEARTIARYFAAIADVPAPAAADAPPMPPAAPPAARIDAGKQKFVASGCAGCHTFGNLPLGLTAEQVEGNRALNAMAPNLRFARERMAPDTIVAWIMDPQAMKPSTIMPKLNLAQADAELLRDFILFADPAVQPEPAAEEPALPPAVDHPVGWAEVKERVLGKVCVHCHMNDHEKDTGPGNLGGFGYAGLGLSFRTYERAVWGARDLKGVRYSVFIPRQGEKVPPVLQAMLRRRVENRRDLVGPLADHERPHYADAAQGLGMPMGLPSMTDEEFGILRAWIEQGCPGPTAVSGKPGFTDGFLVPDGPIKVNKGCQLRKPSTPPPKWAAAPGGG
ncbi:MAG TPA: hypothetical protein VL172_17505 [Kofleriaceae bacterium]|jgi:hypothetical protein|nr:hypothetical protein [Kofleriaceae bacterium]